MCSWLSGAILGTQTRPSNPANTAWLVELSLIAERRLGDLAQIADELGSHADADLDSAWSLIQQFDENYPRGLTRQSGLSGD
jgi:hypothetical protein